MRRAAAFSAIGLAGVAALWLALRGTPMAPGTRAVVVDTECHQDAGTVYRRHLTCVEPLTERQAEAVEARLDDLELRTGCTVLEADEVDAGYCVGLDASVKLVKQQASEITRRRTHLEIPCCYARDGGAPVALVNDDCPEVWRYRHVDLRRFGARGDLATAIRWAGQHCDLQLPEARRDLGAPAYWPEQAEVAKADDGAGTFDCLCGLAQRAGRDGGWDAPAYQTSLRRSGQGVTWQAAGPMRAHPCVVKAGRHDLVTEGYCDGP